MCECNMPYPKTSHKTRISRSPSGISGSNEQLYQPQPELPVFAVLLLLLLFFIKKFFMRLHSGRFLTMEYTKAQRCLPLCQDLGSLS